MIYQFCKSSRLLPVRGELAILWLRPISAPQAFVLKGVACGRGVVLTDRDFAKKTVALPNGLTMAYVEINPGASPCIVWIHGMGSYRETFHSVLTYPPVAARHLAIDLPGFGDSGRPRTKQTLADYAEAVNQFLSAVNGVGAILSGHSFGGMVAGETAARYPDRVGGVILTSAAGWMDPINALSPTRFIWVNRVGIWMTGMEWFGRRMLKALGVDPKTVSRDDRRRLRYGWRRAYEMARMGAFYHSPQFAQRLFAASLPTAVIHGSRDSLFPLQPVRAIINNQSPVWAIEGSGHVPFLSHPRQFSRVFREAFAYIQNSPRSGSR